MLFIGETKICDTGHDDSKPAAQLFLSKAQIDMMKGNDADTFSISYIWCLYDQLQIDAMSSLY